jgi:chaperonin GroEL
MMAKRVTYGQEARLRMLSGIALASRAAATTFGPRGRYVIVDRHYGPPLLRDGVGAVRAIELADPIADMGVGLVRQVAVQTADLAGDGTTSAVVLFHALAAHGIRAAAGGIDLVEICAGIRDAAEAALGRLAELAVPVAGGDHLEQLATVAANGDTEIGRLVRRGLEAAGDHGLLTIRAGRARETLISESRGYLLETRPHSEALAVDITNGLRELEDVLVLVVDGPVASFDALTPLAEEILPLHQPLLLIAESIAPDAVAGLIENKRGNILDAAAVRSTLSGERRSELLRDITVFTGAELVETARGVALESVTAASLGRLERAVFKAEETLLVGGGGDIGLIEERRLALQAERETAQSDYERDALGKRLAYLGGRLVTIEVGGGTELEAKERRDRIDTAAKAAKSALRHGFVAGGGLAHLAAADALRNLRRGSLGEDVGIDVMHRALQAPARQIFANAGIDFAAVVGRLDRHYPAGIDVSTGERCDLIARGIIDSAGVLATGLTVAAALAQLLLRSEATVSSVRPAS